MTDPLRDPRFPDRPQHPDFWRLSEAVLYLDGEADEGGRDIATITAGLVDPESLSYLCTVRAERFLLQLGMPNRPALVMAVAAGMLNGVATGILFEQRGGHRAP